MTPFAVLMFAVGAWIGYALGLGDQGYAAGATTAAAVAFLAHKF